jgi:hypothetical protein
MPFIPVPNSAEVEIRMELDSQKVENTLWFETTAPPTSANLADLTAALYDWWVAEYSPLVTSQLILREIVATSQDTATGPQDTFAPPVLSTGTDTGAPLPNMVSLTVSFRTGFRGRSFRGRNYVVGITEPQVVNNNIDPTLVTAWRSAYDAILTSLGSTDYTWVVASRFSGVDGDGHPIPRVTGIVTPVTTVVVVDPVLDVQRRRLPGRGS